MISEYITKESLKTFLARKKNEDKGGCLSFFTGIILQEEDGYNLSRRYSRRDKI